MAGLSSELRKLLSSSEPPYPAPKHRPGTLSIAEIDRQLKPLFNKASPTQQLISATLYLWHDHLDEAHSLALEIETSDGSYVHGIMHRREPDYSNARYWFKRVGKHPCFVQLAKRAREIVASESIPHLTALTKSTQWDPYAFIDACEHAAQTQNAAEIKQLRQIQAAELELLLERFTTNL